MEDFNALSNILKELKTLGCSGIKISFEDEGATFNEIITMRYLTSINNIELSIKIGGCEAKRDILDCIDVCCDTIVSPMIESSFALKKFTDSLNKYNYNRKKSFNLETFQGYINLNEIIENIHLVDSVTFGRVDFVSSVYETRDYVESSNIYDMAENVFQKSKEKNILCNLGGAISIKSKDFIKKLINKNLLDYFETRYVIFRVKDSNIENLQQMLYYANLFEVQWMKFIQNKYQNYANKDSQRIKMIEERIQKNNS